MKIRTDFVTNSSSSSFVVEVEVELADQSRYVFETKADEHGADSNFQCSGEDIAKTDTVDALCDLLQQSMSGTGKTKIAAFTSEVREKVERLEEIERVTLRRIWISMGESSGWTIANDEKLQALARSVVNASETEKEAACQELVSYLKNAEVYAEGGWQDAWPTGFGGNRAIPRYKWEYLGLTAEALAEKIVAGQIDHNDLAVETVVVDLQEKSVAESAEFIVDSQEKGIGKKPARRSNKFFTNVILSAWSEYGIKQGVSVLELIPDYGIECDPVDYVLYKDGVAKVAVSVKTSINSRSKSFKALAPACATANLEYVLLDEKKDNTEMKIITRINEALFADVFAKYVVGNETEGLTETDAATSGTGCTVKVKFADNRSYEYNCFEPTRVGDLVRVGGAKSGKLGMVLAITGDKTFPGYFNVEKLVRF